MIMMSKAAMGIAVGIAGLFVGYCFYFDQRRRSDPNFKKKLRERRKIKKQAQKDSSRLPDLKDHEGVQRFFVQEIQFGEEKLINGDVDGAVEHLSNAIAICGQPSQLLQVLEKTLPPQVFKLIIHRLPSVSEKLISQTGMAEEDVE